MKTNPLQRIKKGDILISREGSKTKILGRVGDLIARSAWERFDTFSEWLTIEEAHLRDYRLQHKGRYPITKAEAAAMLGADIVD